MPRLIAALTRHGDYHQLVDTPSAHQPFPLTEKGIIQSKTVAQELLQLSQEFNCVINPAIVSSELLRAWQTADIIRASLGDAALMVEQHTDLAERCVGSAANLSISEINRIIEQDPRYQALPKNWKSDSFFCLPFQGAESLMLAGRRVADLLIAEMQALHTQSKTNQLKIFVGHGAAIRHAAYHLGILKQEQIAQLSMYHCRPLYFEYLDNAQWRHVAGNWKIRSQHSQHLD
jgi:2,3-bisphosphoglycerate-dependent phosphoglycerate mutase